MLESVDMKETNYLTTIGLEIHAELNTKTKMFCDSKNNPDEKRPNVNVCPICMGHPGTLPVINKEAVKHVLKVGIAVGGKLADKTEFDRKNYFYPDIPKGYQISQYKHPLVSGGELAGIKITRIHLEEDTGKSQHDKGNESFVDYNRAGVPLMELVTEPVIHTAEDAVRFAKELQLLLTTLGVAEANMEKGEMRVEANISVSKDPNKFGTKVEVKNLNSFRSVEKAIVYEVERHISLLSKGEKIVQETRGFDETNGTTFSQRQKEDSHDYRYFPDPDLPKLVISEIPEFSVSNLSKEIPELPSDKRIRYKRDFGIKEEDIEIYVTTPWGRFFEDVITFLRKKSDKDNVKTASNYISSDLIGITKKIPKTDIYSAIKPEDFAELIALLAEGKISSRGAKDILLVMYETGKKPYLIAEEKDLFQKSNEGELMVVIKNIIEANPSVVADYKKGKQAAIQFFVGQGMKATKGSANPEILKKIILQVLS